MTQYVDPKQLRDVLTQYYSDSELHSMCFDLNIDYESLGGRGKSEQALKLVLYAQRTNRLNDVASYVRRTRDFIQLRTGREPFPMLQDASGPGSAPSQVTYVLGDQVSGDKVGGDKVGGDKMSFSGPVTGSAIKGGSINAENIAGRDVNIHVTQSESRDDFVKLLQELKALLQQAAANGELEQAEGETAVSDLQDVIDETDKPTPRANRIIRRLEDVADVVKAGVKTGTAVLAAKPIIQKLIQAVSTIF